LPRPRHGSRAPRMRRLSARRCRCRTLLAPPFRQCSGAAMVIVNPIPGQESRNSDFLLENGAAIKVNNIATLKHKVSALLHDNERLAQIKANARRLGRPRAAFDVVNRSLAIVTR